jgi:hypothetical protein
MQDISSASVRRLQRVAATIPINLLLDREDSKTGHDAITVDFSLSGARVRTSLLLSPGETVQIVLWGNYGQAIPSRVVWVHGASVFGSLAGLEFVNPLPA